MHNWIGQETPRRSVSVLLRQESVEPYSRKYMTKIRGKESFEHRMMLNGVGSPLFREKMKVVRILEFQYSEVTMRSVSGQSNT